jgi:type I restriction enzyme S subunit
LNKYKNIVFSEILTKRKDIIKNVDFVKLLRQSILQEAIQGKITAEWRKQNPNTEPAIELLKRIKKEREQLVKENKREKSISPISKNEIPFELPQGWMWCRLGEIIEMIYGDSLTKKQCIDNAPYPVYGSNGIVGYYNEYLSNKKTIIVGRKGSAGSINKCYSPSWTTDVAYYIEETNNLNFDFIFYLLKYLQLENLGKGIKPGINRNEVYNLIINLPPFSEQQVIVNKLETLLEKCNKLQEEIENMNKNSKELLRALFNETFGETNR